MCRISNWLNWVIHESDAGRYKWNGRLSGRSYKEIEVKFRIQKSEVRSSEGQKSEGQNVVT